MTEKKNNYEKYKDYYREYYKKYNEINRDYVRERNREYYRNNKEKICQKRCEKIKCEECGIEITRSYMKSHEKTKKHISALES